MTPGFWRGKRVFLTGHTGFKGSWLSLWLSDLGAHVTGFALSPPTQPSLYEAARVGEGIESVIADLRNPKLLNKAIRAARPEIVFHLAAQPLVRYSYQAPIETFETNVMGTAYLLEAIRGLDCVRSVVVVTTDKCYENRELARGYSEDEPLGGYDPYSSSKACAELVAAAYRNSFFNPSRYQDHGVALATARAGNVIGGGDWAADRLIPDILRAFEAEKPVAIRYPNAIRPWQHVLEPLHGYLTLAERLFTDGPAFSEAWNFGPADDDAKPVQWIVERLTALWGGGARWQLDSAPQPHEAHYLKLDCSKAKLRLDWHPRWELDAALGRVIAWHKGWLGGEEMRRVCLQQVAEYQAAIVAAN